MTRWLVEVASTCLHTMREGYTARFHFEAERDCKVVGVSSVNAGVLWVRAGMVHVYPTPPELPDDVVSLVRKNGFQLPKGMHCTVEVEFRRGVHHAIASTIFPTHWTSRREARVLVAWVVVSDGRPCYLAKRIRYSDTDGIMIEES